MRPGGRAGMRSSTRARGYGMVATHNRIGAMQRRLLLIVQCNLCDDCCMVGLADRGASTMTDNTNTATWINFTADDLPKEQHELFQAMLKAKQAFEASFPCRDGFALRFSYKGADFSRMGFCEVAAPKTKAQVATSLSAWIATQRAQNRAH